MNKSSTASVLTITGLTVLGGLVAYAAYFDYKRRSDPSFRKKLRTQKKKVEQHVAEEKGKEAARASAPLDIPRELLLAIHEKSKEEPVPTNPEERHQFFVGVVAAAERLAAEGPHNYLEAAVYFYQALRVYPTPAELIAIYEKTVPEPILMIVMELYNLDVSTSSQAEEGGMEAPVNLDGWEAGQGPPGYFDDFPPKSMNVSVKQLDPVDTNGGQMRAYSLVANKGFKAGDELYKESPVVAVLDVDMQGRGTHCSHCLREITESTPISPESDRLDSVYCSEKCRTQCNIRSQDLLFNDTNPLPAEFAIDIPQSAKETRPKAQDAFADYWRKSTSSGLLLVARLVAMQIVAELAKALPQAMGMKAELPEISINSEYTLYDHMERLRFVDATLAEDEHDTLNELLLATLPFLENAHTDERHAVFRGKMAYNAIGVCLGQGRDNKPDSSERTRTPYGTAKQIGSGLYLISSYLAHSCIPSVRPSFISGTSELHLIATRDIEEGEELTMAYVDVAQHPGETPVEARTRRRAELLHGWKFSCACEKCIKEKETIEVDGGREE
ncbi:hypothetical protein M0805_007384 [Coniferiporia weirii]|nr:hypothetical protein M0805_007384 [Coniferiporia weirii]